MFTALTEELLELQADMSGEPPLADACSDSIWAALVCAMAGQLNDPWEVLGFGGCCSRFEEY